MAYFKLPDETDAQAIKRSVHAVIELALDIGHARATDRTSYPEVPHSEHLADWLTSKTLADLLDAGCRPEGWQEHYLPEEPR